MKKPAEKIHRSAALRAASAKLDIVGDRELNERLSWVADSKAEAYRMGAVEAQLVICNRIRRIAKK